MVKGLDIFRERFRQFAGSFVLIGGAACDDWFSRQELAFRATRDLDIVLVIEVLEASFVAAMRSFVEDGGYEVRQRTQGIPMLHRFSKPKDAAFPAMLELFSRSPEGLELELGQQIIPVTLEPDHHSLSAILLDEAYYGLIQSQHDVRAGLCFANASALIPLKARAWLDLSARRDSGEKVDAKDIDKHRTDVFRLAATLPGEAGPEMPATILADLQRFLAAYPEESDEWPRILASLKATFGGVLRPAALRQAIETYFRLSTE